MTKYLTGLFLAAVFALVVQVLPQQASQRNGTALPQTRHLQDSQLNGVATVIDGDTIEIAGERVRLEGIDAPEIDQTCKNNSKVPWPAGKVAAKYLQRLLRSGIVSCRASGRDSYGRMLGRCSVNGRDVNAEMIREGMAWAFRKYSKAYLDEEHLARRAGDGLWAHPCQPAWDYRANRWHVAEGDAPDGCAIKGNITRRGRIYHMPWSRWYRRMRIELERGERWFCNERQALDAGWRPALVR